MQIQQLSAGNLNSLVELAMEMWTDGALEEEYKACENILAAQNETCYLVKEGETFIAFIHIGLRSDYVEAASEFPVAYIEAIYVKPGFQHLGIGKMLVKEAEKWSRQKGCRQIASDTEVNNTGAIAFHNKIGFEEVNRVVCFVKDL